MPLEPTRTIDVRRRQPDGTIESVHDRVVREEPLEIRIDDEALAVVMRTPGDDLALAAGLLVSEEIVRGPSDIETIEYSADGSAPASENVVEVQLSPQAQMASEGALRGARRSMLTSASCGVCGKRTIASLHATAPPLTHRLAPDLDLVRTLPERMRQEQHVFEKTGGLHAAALFSANADMAILREDIGRHNAVDKCIGRSLLEGAWPCPQQILLISGRSSFEIVQKALVARIGAVVSVSAPSSLAVDLARASNIALFGFVRGADFKIYA